MRAGPGARPLAAVVLGSKQRVSAAEGFAELPPLSGSCAGAVQGDDQRRVRVRGLEVLHGHVILRSNPLRRNADGQRREASQPSWDGLGMPRRGGAALTRRRMYPPGRKDLDPGLKNS